MARQSDKTGILKVTKPTSSTLAGYLTSTVQDTSGWSGDHDGNKVNQGYMALSSTASTTITTCDTNYPDLWANAPTAWRSGSSLVIPAQGGNAVGEWIDYTPTLSGVTATSVGGTYRVEGDSIRIRIRIIISSVSGGITVGMPSGFTEDTTKYPSNSNSGFYGTAVGVDASANAVWVGSCYFPSAGNIAFYGPDGTSSIWDAVDPFSWTSGDTLTMEVVVPVEELSGNTPVISLQNNIAAGALGLPAATATQAGTVRKAYYYAVGGSGQTITSSLSDLRLATPTENAGFTYSGTYNETITCQVAGVYKITSQITFTGMAAGEYVRIEPLLGGTRKGTTVVGKPDGHTGQSGIATAIATLSVGDTIKIQVVAPAGDVTTLVSRPDYVQLVIEKLDA